MFIVMPNMPAPPKNSAQTDQAYAAMTPSETRVSIVVARWRRLMIVARWKGSAPHTTTGVVRANTTHCQPRNCQAGIIEMSMTGKASAAETQKRSFRSAT